MKTDDIQKFGKLLILIGITGFVASAIISFTYYSGFDQGALPAVSFFVLMLGIVFCFPSLLEESSGQLSTMRIVVFSVTMVFCVTYIKLAWSVGSFENFKIDTTWIYILGLAFGSKAFQKFSEDNTNGGGNNANSNSGSSSDVPPLG